MTTARARRAAGNWLAALGGAVLALAVAEVVTRRLVPDPALRFENSIGMFVQDPVVGYRNKPNFRGYAQGSVPIRVNSLGCRGAEIAVPKPAQTVRVLGLGDSVTWGVGVADDATYLRVLERMLNAARVDSSGERFDVANCSVVGYSFFQELLTLQRDAATLAPDIVLIGFALNDFYPTEDPFFNVNAIHEPRKEDVRRRVYPDTPPARFYFLRLLRSAGRNLRNRLYAKLWPAERPEFLNPHPWSDGSFEARAWPILQQQLLTMKRTSDAQGMRLLILLFPTAPQIRTQNHFPQDVIGRFLQSAGIEYMDLFDVYQGREDAAFHDAMHLTPAGHQMTAAAILRRLQSAGWLAAAPSDQSSLSSQGG
jgi:lysophospholipase L1-like esterase